MKMFGMKAFVVAAAIMMIAPHARADETTASAGTAAATPPVPTPMTMFPGDAMDINIAGYANSSGMFYVNAQGNVVVPGATEIHVGGMPGPEAVALVRQTLTDMFKSGPMITVRDLHRVSVLGQVRAPGLYQIDGTERVADLIARAGGMTDLASLRGMRVTRESGTVRGNLGNELKSGPTLREIGLQSGDVVYLPQRAAIADWRNWAIIASGLASAVLIADRIRNK